MLFSVFAVTHNAVVFYSMAIFMLIGVAMLLVIVWPYKTEFADYNVVDVVFILALAMWCSTAVFFSTVTAKAYDLVEASVIVSILVGTYPTFT